MSSVRARQTARRVRLSDLCAAASFFLCCRFCCLSGRGTSTFDGTAIAYSVIKFLSERVDCLALFSSHYHMLFDTFKNNDKIALYHMVKEQQDEWASLARFCTDEALLLPFAWRSHLLCFLRLPFLRPAK